VEPIVNPTSTGGAGHDFEHRVGAACLTFLLTGGTPLFVEGGTVVAVHFQTRHMGWNTDDLLLEAEISDGSYQKVAIQVRKTFVLSEKDSGSVEMLRGAFQDFNNRKRFTEGTDKIGLIVSSMSAKFARGLRTLLDCARASGDAPDMPIVAGRQLDPQGQTTGQILGKAGVNGLEPDVADGGPVQGTRVTGVVKRTIGKGQFELSAPTPVEHVLQAECDKVRLDLFVIVVGVGRGGCAAPVVVLILIVVIQIRHTALAIGKHGTGRHIKNPTAAGAGERRTGYHDSHQQTDTDLFHLRTQIIIFHF
jgi:hypothetical protein